MKRLLVVACCCVAIQSAVAVDAAKVSVCLEGKRPPYPNCHKEVATAASVREEFRAATKRISDLEVSVALLQRDQQQFVTILSEVLNCDSLRTGNSRLLLDCVRSRLQQPTKK